MNRLDEIARLLLGDRNDVLVACDELELIGLDLVADRARLGPRYAHFWSERIAERCEFKYFLNCGASRQWNRFINQGVHAG